MAESVIRFHRSQGFTTVFNSVAQDPRLSLAARGLFTMIASLPPDWNYTVSGLAAKANTSRYEIHKCLNEMEAVGYLLREQCHDNGGKFAGNIYVLQDQAPPSENENPPLSEIATTVKHRQRCLPLTVNLTQQKKDLNKRKTEQTPIPPEGDALFERFWNTYPKKQAKPAARRAWAKLAPDLETCRAMAAALARQKRSESWLRDGGRYIPLPATWLNQRRWEDDLPPVGSDRPPAEKEAYGWQE